VDQFIASELARRGLASVTDAERTVIARSMYAAAKRHWNEHRDREED
jgi:hypothetical protein